MFQVLARPAERIDFQVDLDDGLKGVPRNSMLTDALDLAQVTGLNSETRSASTMSH